MSMSVEKSNFLRKKIFKKMGQQSCSIREHHKRYLTKGIEQISKFTENITERGKNKKTRSCKKIFENHYPLVRKSKIIARSDHSSPFSGNLQLLYIPVT